MKSTGTPCRNCLHSKRQTWEHPCCDCMSDEDIALAHMNPNHPVDFVHYEPKEDPYDRT